MILLLTLDNNQQNILNFLKKNSSIQMLSCINHTWSQIITLPEKFIKGLTTTSLQRRAQIVPDQLLQGRANHFQELIFMIPIQQSNFP